MSKNRPFRAQLPRKPAAGDEIVIRGKLKHNARWFSVNFCLPRPPHVPDDQTPPFIAYHFKTIFHDDGSSAVIHNYKNEVWQAESVEQNYWMMDRNEKFTLIFRFHDEVFKVFAEDTQHTPDYEFTHQIPFDMVEQIELWDDIEFVEEIAFRYQHDDIDH
ncbi:32 kDa beta-galactoside-binding lectin lec-3-like [Uranotaenia lowii]|uniref:32 kDa beta-galactoside-binding lectin lec-3-like n=1 Tax=Uranotaenia lowii TaxID=190385 RepID=UPI0024799DEF|nr:32 kDa beta-galactoside-binding lectin lec-3-like [Uranotaenia lowii]